MLSSCRSLFRAARLGLVGAAVGLAATGAASGQGRAPTPGSPYTTTATTLANAPVRAKLTYITNAQQPLAVVSRMGDDGVYIGEKTGMLKVFRLGQMTTVLDLSARVSTENEEGLLGVAFSPTNPSVLYVDYTDTKGAIVVSEFGFNGQTADPATERILVRLPKASNEHNAGTIFFDAEGLLYIAVGDGGEPGDKANNAQRLDVFFGKILRIDPRPDGTKPYAIPAANPFVKATVSAVKRRGEIYAYGLRNPWRASLDAATGDVWIPDVGQSTYEEINRIPAAKAGANFGWRQREGKHAYKGARPRGAIDPVYDYPHADGRCAVVGGGVYRGSAFPSLGGSYFFGDVCTGQISILQPNGGAWEAKSLGLKVTYLTAFGVGNGGEFYAMSLEGPIYRIDSQ